MTNGGVRSVRRGLVLVVAVVWMPIGCGLFGGSGSGGGDTSTADADGSFGPVDAESSLCEKFCQRQMECGLATPDCRAFCTKGERVDLKRCVVEVDDCSGVRGCLESDAADISETAGGSDAETGVDTDEPADTSAMDTAGDVSDTANDGGTGDTGQPVDTADGSGGMQDTANSSSMDSTDSGGN